MKTFDYPMALVGWMDHVHSLYPTYDNLGDILLMQSPINKTILSDIKSVSDTIVFDFLVDGLFFIFFIHLFYYFLYFIVVL